MTFSDSDWVEASHIAFEEDVLVVSLKDGRELRVPLDWYPSLRDATAEQRADWVFIGEGMGVHWPQLDEHLSIRGMLAPNLAVVRSRSA